MIITRKHLSTKCLSDLECGLIKAEDITEYDIKATIQKAKTITLLDKGIFYKIK